MGLSRNRSAKINTDGAFGLNTKTAGLGGTARNHSGQFLIVMGKRFTCQSALESKALALRQVFFWANSRGWSRVVFEIDSSVVSEAPRKTTKRAPWPVQLILQEIKQEKQKFQMMKIGTVNRNANRFADKVATCLKRGEEASEGL